MFARQIKAQGCVNDCTPANYSVHTVWPSTSSTVSVSVWVSRHSNECENASLVCNNHMDLHNTFLPYTYLCSQSQYWLTVATTSPFHVSCAYSPSKTFSKIWTATSTCLNIKHKPSNYSSFGWERIDQWQPLAEVISEADYINKCCNLFPWQAWALQVVFLVESLLVTYRHAACGCALWTKCFGNTQVDWGCFMHFKVSYHFVCNAG